MDAKIDLLRKLPLFSELSRAELRTVAALADELEVPAGTALTVEGETGREFFVLVEGVATVDVDGVTVRTLVAGDFLGEISLLTRGKRTATVRTVVPSRLLVLTDRAFRYLADAVPSFASRTWAATAARTSA
jgi:CRP/FNR family transcriptional regulator, cyclic AMP receptor protein